MNKIYRPCIILPTFNEEKGLEKVLSEIPRGIQAVVVDDGSTDKTADVVLKYMNKGVILLRHEKNRGKWAALKTGINFALQIGYDLIITMDSDGQHSPFNLPKLTGKVDAGFDIVIGSRDYKKMPVVRRIANRLSSFVYKLRTGRKVKDTQSGYRAIKPEILKNMKLFEDGYIAEFEFLVKATQLGYRITEVDVNTIYSPEIKSRIKPLNQIYKFLKYNIVDSIRDLKKFSKKNY